MADAAARREARRRKILENSEYRLQRITGQANNHEQRTDERSKKCVGDEAHLKSSGSTANGILASEAIVGNQSVDSLIEELNADIDVEDSAAQSGFDPETDIFTLLSAQNVPHRRNAARANVSPENGDVSGSVHPNTSNNVRFGRESTDPIGETSLPNGEIDNSRGNVDDRSSSMKFFISSRLVYVALAIVVNITVICKLEHLFGTSIVIPFFVIMIGRLCVCKNDEEPQGSNMLIAALILSNVRPDLVKIIHRLKGSFALGSKIFQDFAVYMFTFVLIHTAFNRYSIDVEKSSIVHNEAQEIFDDDFSI